MEMRDRHVLITGANRGIGRALAKMLAENGAHLHLAVRNQDSELETELKNSGAASVRIWPSDLGSRAGVEKLLKEVGNEPIDILINNAGLFTGGILEEQSLDQVYEMFQVNLLSLIQLTQGILPGMIERGRGKIVNNASVAAYMPIPGLGTYSATKAGVVAFSEGLRAELSETEVSVLTLITPPIKTRLLDSIEAKFEKNFKESPGAGSLPAPQFADMVKEAIQLDLAQLQPKGLNNVGLQIAKYVPSLFRWEMARRFKR